MPVFGVQLGEVVVHDPAGIEAVFVGVEGYHAAELDVQIAIASPAGRPLEPLPLSVGIVLPPVECSTVPFWTSNCNSAF